MVCREIKEAKGYCPIEQKDTISLFSSGACALSVGFLQSFGGAGGSEGCLSPGESSESEVWTRTTVVGGSIQISV